MKRATLAVLLLVMVLAVFAASAYAAPVTRHATTALLPRGTDVMLQFDQSLSSKSARVGERVRMHVANDVMVGNRVVIRAGTPVVGTVQSVSRRKPYGVNAKLRLALGPVRSVSGTLISLQPRSEGKFVGGKKSGEAAGATVGGAAVLGPVGLVGGYFVHGKPVTIHQGDRLDSQVAQNTILTARRHA